ncbi:hypothetical protein Nepgr_017078 [Nepenthes gracilis]|uniref:Uncharacterized protein n=1 Tax=Nepenthes gracilis TaxID=150966 RepID=A0AAD3XRV0_NEPGR|nr:hypothetical protein Nepgr_017078 [Nepenthes gracilis]
MREKSAMHRQYTASLGCNCRRKIAMRPQEKVQLRRRTKAWKWDGLPLKMTVGTGFPSISSKGSCSRKHTERNATDDAVFSTPESCRSANLFQMAGRMDDNRSIVLFLSPPSP